MARRGRRPNPDPAVQFALDGSEEFVTGGPEARPVAESLDALPDVSTSLAAELAGVSPQAVRKWVDAGCPMVARNRFRLPELLRWERARRAERSSGNADMKAELLREQIEGRRIENAQLRGELMSVAAHEAVSQMFATTVKEAISSAVGHVARDAEERRIAEALGRRILERVGEHAITAAEGGVSDPDARRVGGRPVKIATRG